MAPVIAPFKAPTSGPSKTSINAALGLPLNMNRMGAIKIIPQNPTMAEIAIMDLKLSLTPFNSSGCSLVLSFIVYLLQASRPDVFWGDL